MFYPIGQFSHSVVRVRLFAIPWAAALQVSLSITSFWSLLRLMSIKLVMPSNHVPNGPLIIFQAGNSPSDLVRKICISVKTWK